MPPRAGFGLHVGQVAELLAGSSAHDAELFVEVHAENYCVAGGPRLRQLERVRERLELSIHGVGLSIGGEGPLDEEHLDRVAALVRRFEPRRFSEHLAWSSHGGVCFNDLLPLPYDTPSLRRVCSHVHRVQERIGRVLLIENPSTYVEFAASSMDEAQFLGEVVRRTGCGLLLDVNNAYVSARNHGHDAWSLIGRLPPHAVGEIHLAGFAEDHVAEGGALLIDTHGAPVAGPVWELYRRTIERIGPRPTLIERDHDIPPLPVLEAEALQALSIQHEIAARQAEAA